MFQIVAEIQTCLESIKLSDIHQLSPLEHFVKNKTVKNAVRYVLKGSIPFSIVRVTLHRDDKSPWCSKDLFVNRLITGLPLQFLFQKELHHETARPLSPSGLTIHKFISPLSFVIEVRVQYLTTKCTLKDQQKTMTSTFSGSPFKSEIMDSTLLEKQIKNDPGPDQKT